MNPINKVITDDGTQRKWKKWNSNRKFVSTGKSA